MKILAPALAALLCGCTHTEVTLLFGPRYNGTYTELAGNLTVLRRIEGRKACAYIHESELRNGPPFNGRDEQTSDFVGCGVRWSR